MAVITPPVADGVDLSLAASMSIACNFELDTNGVDPKTYVKFIPERWEDRIVYNLVVWNTTRQNQITYTRQEYVEKMSTFLT